MVECFFFVCLKIWEFDSVSEEGKEKIFVSVWCSSNAVILTVDCVKIFSRHVLCINL